MRKKEHWWVPWPKGHPKYTQHHNLRKRYGISLVEFGFMVAERDNRCDCCERHMVPPHVDHNHETGEIRGLICGPCNKGIGLLGDTLEGAQRAVAYLSG